ncbi:FAD-dependent oxidoreductase [Salipaludibacillus sp. CF4.18]|uniref:FAD-dependent oxidoreductase n=1 Tax=Salipaludibacillus sp. CF4.18 TaxID=3373081 RepID=UPI003EE4923F
MNIVIIGGDAAGMSAAMQIVRTQPDWNITVLERGAYYSYAQCGLPYFIGGVIPDSDQLIAREREVFAEKYGIDARIYHDVEAIDSNKQKVTGKDTKSGKKFEVSYDKLLIATGASPIQLPVDGNDLEGIHVLKTIPDAESIVKDMGEDVLTVTVVGGGYIGLEVAENLVTKGKKVRLIDVADRLGQRFDLEISEKIKQQAQEKGIQVVLGESVEAFLGQDRVESLRTDKGQYRSDMIIVAIGIKPNTSIVSNTELKFHDSGAIFVNDHMETNVENIYAAGDCATQYNRIKKKDDYAPLGTHANKQGRTAGLNIAGQSKSFQGIVGTSIMKFFDYAVAKTGLNEEEAKELGIDYGVIGFESHPIAGYYPGGDSLYIRMLKDNETDKLIGVQAMGKHGVAKRIDVAATALFSGLTMEELENLDLSYAPPYNSVWDPLQQAARRM